MIFSQRPKVASRSHFGCRIVEARDGTLFLTLGDRFSRKEDAQKLDNHLGKIVRIAKDGAAPADNPFVGRAGALPEIWSYGHRNGQGATLAPDGKLWMHEHGPQGGDEINIPQAGRNYGWPVITYGENYGGGKIGDGITRKDGHGAAAALLGAVDRALGHGLPDQRPLRRGLEGQPLRGLAQVRLPRPHRTRRTARSWPSTSCWKTAARASATCKQGPDGLLYVLTDESNGKLLRLRPD